jgi:hypothetical protein
MGQRVMAVDPGLLSGVAYAEFGLVPPVPEVWELDPRETVRAVEERLSGPGLAVVACESFVPRPGVRSWQPDALEIIGGLKYVCWRHNTPLVLQSPANAKSFSTVAKLKKLDWRHPTPGGHAEDALRHLLLIAVQGNLIPLEALI